MTFTYLGTLATDLDTIRFEIQDTVENSGIKPNGGNFTDEEINGVLAGEGNVNRTVANLYERLATAWSIKANTQVGARREDLGKIADNFRKLGQDYRNRYGYGSVTIATGFGTRVDGYSQTIDSGEA